MEMAVASSEASTSIHRWSTVVLLGDGKAVGHTDIHISVPPLVAVLCH